MAFLAEPNGDAWIRTRWNQPFIAALEGVPPHPKTVFPGFARRGAGRPSAAFHIPPLERAQLASPPRPSSQGVEPRADFTLEDRWVAVEGARSHPGLRPEPELESAPGRGGSGAPAALSSRSSRALANPLPGGAGRLLAFLSGQLDPDERAGPRPGRGGTAGWPPRQGTRRGKQSLRTLSVTTLTGLEPRYLDLTIPDYWPRSTGPTIGRRPRRARRPPTST
jgi:hypothetical protein